MSAMRAEHYRTACSPLSPLFLIPSDTGTQTRACYWEQRRQTQTRRLQHLVISVTESLTWLGGSGSHSLRTIKSGVRWLQCPSQRSTVPEILLALLLHQNTELLQFLFLYQTPAEPVLKHGNKNPLFIYESI